MNYVFDIDGVLTSYGIEAGAIVDIYESTENITLENYFVAHMPVLGDKLDPTYRHLTSPIFVPKERAELVIDAFNKVQSGEYTYSTDSIA